MTPIDIPPEVMLDAQKLATENDKASRDFNLELLDMGRQLVSDLDNQRWPLGALADRVKREYGKNSFDAFANEIGTTGKSLRGYHRVWKAFSTCVEFREEHQNLTWSHYRAVLRMKKQGLQAMLDLLTQANDNRWNASFTEARAIDAADGKPDAPRLKRVCKDVPCRLLYTQGYDNGSKDMIIRFAAVPPPEIAPGSEVYITISQAIPPEPDGEVTA